MLRAMDHSPHQMRVCLRFRPHRAIFAQEASCNNVMTIMHRLTPRIMSLQVACSTPMWGLNPSRRHAPGGASFRDQGHAPDYTPSLEKRALWSLFSRDAPQAAVGC